MKYGGKANSLLYLASNNILVPKFFIISKDDYIQFLTDNNIYKKIEELFTKKKYKKIKDIIMKQDINSGLANKLALELPELNSHLYAIRSSASNEDGKDKSFAGQYDTFLNVKKEDIFLNIKKCFCSLYNDNVISYSDDFDIYGINVIIQVMIDSDYSGVAFTVDPSSESDNYILIEMTEGLGEKLVSGKVIPNKFFVRKETGMIDLKIGELSLDEVIFNRLILEIEKTEKIYKCPMDIEYAIKERKIFILQARPITARTILPKSFSLTLTRQKSLIDIELYYKGEYFGIKNITKNLYYFKPLFVYNNVDNNVSIYYNNTDLEELPNPMYYLLDIYFDKTLKYYRKIKKDIEYLNNTINNKLEIDYRTYIDKIIEIYPFTSLGQLAGHFNDTSKRVKDLLIEFREKYDYIIYKAVDYLVFKFKAILPDNYKEYIDFLLIDEIINSKLPSIESLENRKLGYIYYNNSLYVTTDYDKFFGDNNINIEEASNSLLNGTFAYSSNTNITGRVCVILSDKDFNNFKRGDIIVTPMTSPKFLSLIKECKAIITDEGGTLSHAAIISRELKIPCLVGCTNATKNLSTGNMIEINKRGEIIIL